MTTRQQLLADRRSGARPLPGSPGAEPPTRPLPAAGGQDEPAEPAAAPQQTPAGNPEPAARGGRTAGSRPGQALAGLIVGLFAWGYALNWLRGGMAQANGWFGAKFFNEPYTAAAAGPGAQKTGSPAGTSDAGGHIVTPGTPQPG